MCVERRACPVGRLGRAEEAARQAGPLRGPCGSGERGREKERLAGPSSASSWVSAHCQIGIRNSFSFWNLFIICKLIWIQFKFEFWWLLLAKIKYKNISPTKENYALSWNATIKYLFKYINYRVFILFGKIGCYTNQSCVSALLIGIGVWKAPPHSPSSSKAGPHWSQEVPHSFKVFLLNALPIYFLGHAFWFYLLQTLSSMSRNLPPVDRQISSSTLHVCGFRNFFWRPVGSVWKISQTGCTCPVLNSIHFDSYS
jgi:hypothetical protein